MRTLNGKVAIVTGAGSGLGRGIAEELARAGADVAILELDPETSAQAAAELAAHGVRTGSYPTDVADGKAVDAAFEAIARDLGRIDVVVNNAGISRVGPHTQDVTDEDWHASIAVMQTGVFFCMRAAGRAMIPQRSGSVINISSIRGFSPNPGRMTYCAPKAAVIMMTKVAAGEWAQFGIRVNAIAPGVLRTPMWDADVARGALRRVVLPGYRPDAPARAAGGGGQARRLPGVGRRRVRERSRAHDRRRADGHPGGMSMLEGRTERGLGHGRRLCDPVQARPDALRRADWFPGRGG